MKSSILETGTVLSNACIIKFEKSVYLVEE